MLTESECLTAAYILEAICAANSQTHVGNKDWTKVQATSESDS